MYLPKEKPIRVLAIFLLALTVVALFYYENNFDHIIDWEIETQADKENFVFHSFQKGPFNFSLEGQKYRLIEMFHAQPISHIQWLPEVFMYLSWTLVCALLAATSYWNRYAFLIVCGLVFVQISLIDLDSLSLFGSREGKRWVSIAFMICTLAPAYYVHAFKVNTSPLMKWIMITVPTSAFLAICHSSVPLLPLHYVTNTQIGFSLMAMIFVFLVAEEILFLLLYIITRSKGRNNEKHLLVFGMVYIGYLGLYYADLYGLINIELFEVDPLYLFFISTFIAIWSFQYKNELYQSFIAHESDVRIFIYVLGLLAYTVVTFALIRGNTPVYDSVSYFSLYAHLGFGSFFLIYLIINFFTPLAQGLAVFRITYKNQNFPYISAKLAGLVIVAAFFFYSDRAPQKMIEGARYNYLGDIYQLVGNQSLSDEYYRQGSVFAWDNHYSNFQLGHSSLNKNDFDEAIYRFTRATIRRASPYAYVNIGNAFRSMNDESRIQGVLREGNLKYPKSGELANNLAVSLINSGSINSAQSIFEENLSTEDWNRALEVNKWSVSPDTINLEQEFSSSVPALKSNILYQLAGTQSNTPTLDGYILDRPNLLNASLAINGSWNKAITPDSSLLKFINGITDAELGKHLNHSLAFNLYANGLVNQAITTLEILTRAVSLYERGYFINQLGLMSLEQGSPILAREYFLLAIADEYEPAYFNLGVADLEAGLWPQAKEDWRVLTQRDSSVTDLYNLLQPVLTNQSDTSFAYVYYRAHEINPDQLGNLLPFFTIEQQRIIWKRIENRLLDEDKAEFIDNYAGLFSDLRKTEGSSIQAIDNAFDLSAVRAFLDNEDITIEVKYNEMVDAISINPYSVFLLKRYCLLAVDMGLPEFARDAIDNLREILAPNEFDTFMGEFTAASDALMSQDWSLE